MEVVHTVEDCRAAVQAARPARVGYVPTMGALHAGHASLIERSVSECGFTVVSVYVNPTQFDNPDDLGKYPVTLQKDVVLAGSLGADLVFAPDYREMYPDDFSYRIEENEISAVLCGAHRPGHFTGVLTVVMKLLNIVRPDRAYFGEKDYQQYRLIDGMVRAFFLETEIVPCPIVRESDGLALSSRNVNLDCDARKRAPLMHELIAGPESDDAVRRRLTAAGFRVDYVESRDGRRFAAVRVGDGSREVRLIDNVALAGGNR